MQSKRSERWAWRVVARRGGGTWHGKWHAELAVTLAQAARWWHEHDVAWIEIQATPLRTRTLLRVEQGVQPWRSTRLERVA